MIYPVITPTKEGSTASNRTTDFGQTTVWSSTASPTVTAIPISGWFIAIQFQKIRATLETRGNMGNIEVSFGYQTADVPSSPDTAVAVGSYLTMAGVSVPSAWVDLSSVTPGKQYIRFVILTRNSSGTTTNLARVGAVMDYFGY